MAPQTFGPQAVRWPATTAEISAGRRLKPSDRDDGFEPGCRAAKRPHKTKNPRRLILQRRRRGSTRPACAGRLALKKRQPRGGGYTHPPSCGQGSEWRLRRGGAGQARNRPCMPGTIVSRPEKITNNHLATVSDLKQLRMIRALDGRPEFPPTMTGFSAHAGPPAQSRRPARSRCPSRSCRGDGHRAPFSAARWRANCRVRHGG